MDDSSVESDVGAAMHRLCERLWPITRSITGNGVRQTLAIIKEFLPDLTVHEVSSGTPVFDWTIPDEWNLGEAWVDGPDGQRVIDVADNNLHIVGYSIGVDATVSLEELQSHLYSLPEQPDAIPYVTSYYERRWGFCIRERDRVALQPGHYRVHIDGQLAPGSLTYGELILPGSSSSEVMLSTYVCHPSMANNELSGPVVTAFLAGWLSRLTARRHTYRIVFVPETIGSIAYLSLNLGHLKKHVVAGFNITCVGDDRCFSYVPSRAGDTLADLAAVHVLRHTDPEFKRYTYLDRGSDERQYCAPGIDLPIATVCRSKFGAYAEYHTSLDDLLLVTPSGLEGSLVALRRTIEVIERNYTPIVTVLGEPQLSKRHLYPSLGTTASRKLVKPMMDLLAYADGSRTILEIAELIGVPMWELAPIEELLQKNKILRIAKSGGEPRRIE